MKKSSRNPQDQATGSRRSIEASESLNIPVNSFSLASRIPRSSVKDETEYKYVDGKGFTETKHKASVIRASTRSQMQLGHRAVTSVRNDRPQGYRRADMYNEDGNGGCSPCSIDSYGPGRRRKRVSDED